MIVFIARCGHRSDYEGIVQWMMALVVTYEERLIRLCDMVYLKDM